ncbi:SCO family protein [Bdellovibrio sp. ZAP7]|uniref:SCO family protein n=1 Tax=Bdellovibrio sp. ZAP7 TaxID=2231053 RepID=UPI001FF0444E|nr:SCO family protein [Bdellovibrio sp. ZAP7]
MSAALAVTLVFALKWYQNRQPELGGDFQANYNGSSWKFSDDPKKLNLLYFGYAKCPDVCPMALTYTSQAFQSLTENQKKNVRLIFISVDVEHDTPANVAVYAQNFDPSFIGLSGTKQNIDTAVKTFAASYIEEKDTKSYLGYSISHTDRIYFLNKNGIVLDTLPNPRSADSIVQKIKENL